ncbi:MAG: hypothetical protein U9O87_02670 [Verrucomicrobiota bacterium]|nr:hypothetical protein [Verrucomicrobiota bacterium]
MQDAYNYRSIKKNPKEGERIKFDIDLDESNILEADGTGIPILNNRKALK